jgi:hypothetical protein
VSTASPEYLCWSESPITFDQTDHPDSIPKHGRFSLIVDLLVGRTQLKKALMYGGNGLNLLHLNTFDGLGLAQFLLQSSVHLFYIVVLGKQSIPLGQVTLSVIFRDASSYHTEMLTFKVVDFSKTYHVILGRPCYVKFTDIPSYFYLKLKIPGPGGIITMEAKA